MAGSWPGCTATIKNTGFLLMCWVFYSLAVPHPLAEIDKKKMDWTDFFPA